MTFWVSRVVRWPIQETKRRTAQTHAGQHDHLHQPLQRPRLTEHILVGAHLDDNTQESQRAADENVLLGALRLGNGSGEELPDGLDERTQKGRREGVRVPQREELENRADLGANFVDGRGRRVVLL